MNQSKVINLLSTFATNTIQRWMDWKKKVFQIYNKYNNMIHLSIHIYPTLHLIFLLFYRLSSTFFFSFFLISNTHTHSQWNVFRANVYETQYFFSFFLHFSTHQHMCKVLSVNICTKKTIKWTNAKVNLFLQFELACKLWDNKWVIVTHTR